ncbi:odorant binding protein 1 [Megalopta genalis]|uniref:odorant binding protein 1 n=1 Tax=Megalopta genalis TaxID=115081 RepID=UPI001443726C|nr:general odorant-binding protein 69a-like [Megalopta genalis]
MASKHGLLFLGLVYLQAALVRAVPDWVPPEIIDMVQDDKQRCMEEHGTSEAMIQEVAQGKISSDRSITCYMYCLLEAFSLVDDEANLETDMLMGILPEHLQDLAEQILGKCNPAAGSDNCEKMYNLAVCVQQAVPEMWFIV